MAKVKCKEHFFLVIIFDVIDVVMQRFLLMVERYHIVEMDHVIVTVVFHGEKEMRRVKNWARKARAKGYRVERDDVLIHRNNFVFAFRIPSKQQVGELRCLDVVVCKNPPEFHQCKYHKKYFHKEEKERLLALASKYNCLPVLCHRELGKGLKFETLS